MNQVQENQNHELFAGRELHSLSDIVLTRPAPEVTPEQLEAYKDSLLQFNFDLTRKVLDQEEAGKNVFVSPISVALALSLTLNGADGETRKEIQAAMSAAGFTTEELNTCAEKFMAELKKLEPAIQLSIANSIWSSKDFEFSGDYQQAMQKHYNAEAAALDFRNDPQGAADVINGWVDDKTKQKISKIIEQLSPATVAVLVNAIYFKGNWASQFKKENTTEAEFTAHDGSAETVEMMSQYGEFAHTANAKYQAVRLPYEGGKSSMVVILPKEGENAADLMASLDAKGWKELNANLRHERNGTVEIPKFKLEYGKELSSTLQALGIGSAFDDSKADFSNLLGVGQLGDMAIDQVLHKAVIEVNEEGAEAAAVTAVVIRATCASIGPMPFRFRADRPFIYAIEAEGVPLFYGVANSFKGDK